MRATRERLLQRYGAVAAADKSSLAPSMEAAVSVAGYLVTEILTGGSEEPGTMVLDSSGSCDGKRRMALGNALGTVARVAVLGDYFRMADSGVDRADARIEVPCAASLRDGVIRPIVLKVPGQGSTAL